MIFPVALIHFTAVTKVCNEHIILEWNAQNVTTLSKQFFILFTKQAKASKSKQTQTKAIKNKQKKGKTSKGKQKHGKQIRSKHKQAKAHQGNNKSARASNRKH